MTQWCGIHYALTLGSHTGRPRFSTSSSMFFSNTGLVQSLKQPEDTPTCTHQAHRDPNQRKHTQPLTISQTQRRTCALWWTLQRWDRVGRYEPLAWPRTPPPDTPGHSSKYHVLEEGHTETISQLLLQCQSVAN